MLFSNRLISNSILDGSIFQAKKPKIDVEANVNALDNYINSLKRSNDAEQAFNEALKDGPREVQKYVKSLNGLTPDIEEFRNQQEAANAQMRFTGTTGKLAAAGMAALSSIGSGLINMGINFALSLIVQGITDLMNAQQEAIDKANELTQTYKDNTAAINDSIKSISGSKSEFEQLAAGVDEQGNNLSLTTEQYEKYQGIISEIAATCPELVKGYTAEGQAIIDKNGAIEQAIALLEKQKELEKDQYINSTEVESGKTLEVNQAKDNLKSAISDLNKTYRLDMIQTSTGIDTTVYDSIGIDRAKLEQGDIQEAQKLVSKQQELIELLKERHDLSESDLGMMKQQLVEIQAQISSVETLNTELENYYSMWAADDSNAYWYNQIDPSMLQSFNDAIGDIVRDTNISDKKQAIIDLANSMDEVKTKLPTESFAAFNKALREGSLDQDVYEDLLESLDNIGDASPEFASSIEVMTDSLNRLRAATILNREELISLPEAIRSASEEYSLLNSAISTVSSGQSLSIDTIISLLEAYPELEKNLIKTSNGYTIEATALESLRKTKIAEEKATIEANLAKTQSVLDHYGVAISATDGEIEAIVQKITIKKRELLSEYNLYSSGSGSSQTANYQKDAPMLQQYNKAINELNQALTEIQNNRKKLFALDISASSGSSSSGSAGISNTTAAIQEQNTALQDHLALLEHQKAMGAYDGNQAKYIDDLTYAYNNLAKTQDERWSLEEKIYSARKSWEEEQKRAAEERQKAEEEEAERKKKELEDYLSSLEKAKSAVEELVDLRIKLIEKEKEAEKEALEAAKDAEKEKLDSINKTIDARKEALRQMKEEKDSAEELAERQKAIQNIQRELTALSADDSASATARKLELEEQLAEKQKELADYQYEQNLAKQEEALDREAELAQQEYDQKAAQYDEQIAAIEEFLSKQGLLFQTALNDINNMNDEMYQQMIEYNKEYGDSLDSSIKKIWDEASAAMAAYKGELESVGDAYERISGLIAENNKNEYAPAPGSSTPSQGAPSSGGTPAAQPSAPASNTVGGYPKSGTLSVARGSWVIRAGTNTATAAVGYVFGGESYGYSDVYIDPSDGSVWRLISKGGRSGWIGPKAVASYALGGVDSTGGYKLLHGAPGAVETIFNAAQGKRLYDLVASPSELSRSVAANLARSIAGFSRIDGSAQAPLVIHQGDIVINGNAEDEAIRRLEQLQRETIDKTVRQINQNRYKKGYALNAKAFV